MLSSLLSDKFLYFQLTDKKCDSIYETFKSRISGMWNFYVEVEEFVKVRKERNSGNILESFCVISEIQNFNSSVKNSN